MKTRSHALALFLFRALARIERRPRRLSELRLLWREVRRFVGEYAPE
jgi:hypothetical protein